MAELLHQGTPLSAHGQGNRTREVRYLSTESTIAREEIHMLDPEIQYVVGIDVAKRSHTICAIEARTGRVHLRPRSVAATVDGYAELRSLLQSWGPPEMSLLGLEATGCLWEPVYEALTAAGYTVLVLNPRQTASRATSLGLRAKTDGIDAHTLARGILAGYPRASSLPSELVQELRALTRARQDLVHSQTAAKQRLRDELVVLFPELPQHTPEGCDLFTPARALQLSAGLGRCLPGGSTGVSAGGEQRALGGARGTSTADPGQTLSGQYPGGPSTEHRDPDDGPSSP